MIQTDKTPMNLNLFANINKKQGKSIISTTPNNSCIRNAKTGILDKYKKTNNEIV